jgi:hypothetical protein
VRVSRGRVFLLSSLYWLISRAVLFLFIFSLLLFALYLLGNFQQFLDSSQIMLLQILKICLLAEFFWGALYVALVFLLRRQRRLALKVVLCLLSMLFCGALLLLLSFLSAWLKI